MKVKTLVPVISVAALALFGLQSCSPGWAKTSDSQVMLLMTGINSGAPLTSDVQTSSGAICPDLVDVRVENHFKNPAVTATGFRHDFTIERYEVRYFRSDGRNTQGVDVPYSITGNVAHEIIEESATNLTVEVVRRQAKLEPPLRNLTQGGGAIVVTMFAEITLHARTTTGEVTNPVSGRLQIDFADFADSDTGCP